MAYASDKQDVVVSRAMAAVPKSTCYKRQLPLAMSNNAAIKQLSEFLMVNLQTQP